MTNDICTSTWASPYGLHHCDRTVNHAGIHTSGEGIMEVQWLDRDSEKPQEVYLVDDDHKLMEFGDGSYFEIRDGQAYIWSVGGQDDGKLSDDEAIEMLKILQCYVLKKGN
jgi:hypothetical protein